MNDELGGISEVTFHPQQWDEYAGDKYAEAAVDHEPTSFFVPTEDATDEDGEPLQDDTYESDALHEHEYAPEWVQTWDGPFYVAVDHGIVAGDALDRLSESSGDTEWAEEYVGGDEL